MNEMKSCTKRIPNTSEHLFLLSVILYEESHQCEEEEVEVWRLPIIAWDISGEGVHGLEDVTGAYPITIESQVDNELRALLDTRTGSVYEFNGGQWWRSVDDAVQSMLHRLRQNIKRRSR
ncbi:MULTISPECIES: hypothetical protein [Methylocaldum]|uniref:hypothetical protein n=1 Tax=Methylocaldum sp. 14B TaxID=1912213 RepID=UPI00117CB5AF|nr:hypothetical protein [Methylocaldum sp. 14B]MVF20562.1 hypothetical protein [Methylocaldum sp. BRCS4]